MFISGRSTGLTYQLACLWIVSGFLLLGCAGKEGTFCEVTNECRSGLSCLQPSGIECMGQADCVCGCANNSGIVSCDLLAVEMIGEAGGSGGSQVGGTVDTGGDATAGSSSTTAADEGGSTADDSGDSTDDATTSSTEQASSAGTDVNESSGVAEQSSMSAAGMNTDAAVDPQGGMMASELSAGAIAGGAATISGGGTEGGNSGS